jgi:hypothetical protein
MEPAKSWCMTEEEISVAYLTYLGEDDVLCKCFNILVEE